MPDVIINGKRATDANFITLLDTPTTYTGFAGYVVKVNATETGLEFAPDVGSNLFVGLTDTPNSYTGQGGLFVRVNATETGLEFIDGTTLFVGKDGDIITTNNQYIWNVQDWTVSANTTGDGATFDNVGTGADLNVGVIRASGTKPNMLFGDAWFEMWHPTLNNVLWNIRNDGQARFFAGASYSGQLEIYTGMTVWNQATIRGDPGFGSPAIRFNYDSINVEFNDQNDQFIVTMAPSQFGNPFIIETDTGTAVFEINPQGQIETYSPKSYIYAYDTTQQTVATANTWQDVAFDTVEISDGDITHPNATDFVFNVGGTFLVSYSSNFFRTGTPTGTIVATRIVLNGAEIQGSYVTRRIPGNGIVFTDAKTVIIQANAGDVLKIQLNGTATNVGIDPNTPFANLPASITLNIMRVV